MNVLSLFDGMSCGQLALKKAGIYYDTYYASEIDKYAIKVSSDNFPNIIHLGDVTQIKAENLPKIDLLIGGSPCQGFSFAGKQLNFNDPRSALFFEYVRLLKELKPKYFLLENVVMKKEYQDIITEHLGIEPVRIESSDFSAQKRRQVVFEKSKKPIRLGAVTKSMGTRVYHESGKSICLSALGGGWGAKTGLYHDDYCIRKLSVLECKRLQTVPDDYRMEVSNSQAYKMLGNGWTVDVVAHILKGIKGKEDEIRF